MAIIFMHGVNTREGPAYTATCNIIRRFLVQHLGKVRVGQKVMSVEPRVYFPYWGSFGCNFVWNMASLPQPEMQALGPTVTPELQPVLAHLCDALPGPLGPEPLARLAKENFLAAIEALCEIALVGAREGHEDVIAQFIMQASAYAENHTKPTWLSEVEIDADFIAILAEKLLIQPGCESQGGLNDIFTAISLAYSRVQQAIRQSGGTILDKAGNFMSSKLLAWNRESLNAVLGRFFGDVFVYLDGRGNRINPGELPSSILSAFKNVKDNSPPTEPFIIIGHSLGGVITYDLLSHFCPDLEVDLFVSVGSQVAHFEELKLYKASDKSIGPPNKIAKPPNIKYWINIFDEVDIFSYSAERIFSGIEVDAQYDTQTYTIKAHGAYFQQSRFYRLLRERIGALQ